MSDNKDQKNEDIKKEEETSKQEEDNSSVEAKNEKPAEGGEVVADKKENEKPTEETSDKDKENDDASSGASLDEAGEDSKDKEAENNAETEDKKEEFEEVKEEQRLKPGMTVRVFQKIKELNIKGEEKERTQYFEGMIIAKKHGKEAGGTITVHKVSGGVGVEKIFPLNLPTIEKIEVKKEAKVRRSKLYFLRRGFRKKFKEKKVS